MSDREAVARTLAENILSNYDYAVEFWHEVASSWSTEALEAEAQNLSDLIKIDQMSSSALLGAVASGLADTCIQDEQSCEEMVARTVENWTDETVSNYAEALLSDAPSP